MYAKLLRLVSSVTFNDVEITGFDFMGNMTKSSIQLLLLDIYNYFINYIKGKDGLFRQTVMGKSIDYGARLVISSAQFNKDRYDQMLVDFEHTGVPLAQAITLFFPFVIKYVQDFFETNMMQLLKMNQIDGKLIEPGDLSSQFSHEKIKKYIKRYINSPSERFDDIYAVVDGKKYKFPLRYKNNDTGEIEVRYITWTDLLFIAAYDVCKDKYVYITRYPLEDYMGIYPSKITVLSTFNTISSIELEGVEGLITNTLTNYPVVINDLDKTKVDTMFIDSLQVFNGMLKALGGDYDGSNVAVLKYF